MNSLFTSATIVVVANDVNISIFKPIWLIKTGILKEEELKGDILFSPVAVQIPTERFIFAIFPNRIQLNFNKPHSDYQSEIIRIIGGVVKTLPHTPYSGIGLNFDCLVAPEDEGTFNIWNRELFVSKFADKIQTEEDARFGTYFSFNTLEARLKISIKPTKGKNKISEIHESWHDGQEIMKLNFNFHYEVDRENEPLKFILKVLGKWPQALTLAQEISKKVSN